MNHDLHGGAPRDRRGRAHDGHRKRTGHWLVMFACCVPMILIVGFLYLTGAVGIGFVVAAVVCVALMPLMHGSMSHGDDGGQNIGGSGP